MPELYVCVYIFVLLKSKKQQPLSQHACLDHGLLVVLLKLVQLLCQRLMLCLEFFDSFLTSLTTEIDHGQVHPL